MLGSKLTGMFVLHVTRCCQNATYHNDFNRLRLPSGRSCLRPKAGKWDKKAASGRLMIFLRILVFLVLTGIGAPMGGCAWMPTNGPSGDDVYWGRNNLDSVRYELVRVTREVERVLSANAPRLARWVRDTSPPTDITF